MLRNLQTKLEVFFALAGIVAGIVCAPLSGRLAPLSLLVLFCLFYLCHRLAPKILKFEPSQLSGGWSMRVAFKYFDVFFFLWLVFWILAYTDLLRL